MLTVSKNNEILFCRHCHASAGFALYHCQMKTDILERDWPSAALVERHKDGIRLMFANGRYASF